MLILLFSEVSPCCRLGAERVRARRPSVPRACAPILPTLTLGLIQMASFMRFTRSSLLEVLRRTIVRTARAKGLGGGRVIWRTRSATR